MGGDRAPTTLQRWVAISWYVLAGAFALIAGRALLGGEASWWAWAIVTAACVGVGLLHWHARRVLPWLNRALGL